METPPRAWGRPPLEMLNMPQPRNTPTGVGKTSECADCAATREKHPHGRGEDGDNDGGVFLVPETPPRAWGRPCNPAWICSALRNTPTGVGKTSRIRCSITSGWKHPHGRGEDCHGLRQGAHIGETPPRAWGRRTARFMRKSDYGNTPTGVGKTSP